MPTSVSSIKVDTKRLDELIAKLEPRASNIIKDTALDVEAEAKIHVPRDPQRPPQDPTQPVTGNLRNSIQAIKKQALLWWVQVGADYGIYQELGTSRIPARPYLVPAVEKLRASFAKRWGELFK